MGFRKLIEEETRMGPFQMVHVTLLCFPLLLVPSHNLMQIFTAAVPAHRCHISIDGDHKANITHYPNTSGGANFSKDPWHAFVPMDADQKPEQCLRFKAPQWQLLAGNTSSVGYETEICIDGWEYDRSIFTSTIVSEWNLVCDLRSSKEFAQSIYMAGVLVGAFVFGGLADRFGRRSILLWCSLQIAVMGSGAAFAPNFPAYCIFRFFTGMGLSGLLLNDFSLAVEWIPIKFRDIVFTALGYCITLSQLILAGVAYGIRDWHYLQLALSLPYFIVFLYSWWVPESARWLVLNNKPEVALKTLKWVARMNGKQEEGENISLEALKAEIQKGVMAMTSRHSVFDLFRTPSMCKITCCMTLVWYAKDGDNTGSPGERFPGCNVALCLFVHCGAIPYSAQADRNGLHQYDDEAGGSGGPRNPDDQGLCLIPAHSCVWPSSYALQHPFYLSARDTWPAVSRHH
ncbi:solute carrier family 22 member 6-B isoform X2 [Microcaecilia unicolor]|uniref:Solute carrier family 22 member 6-B-like isoform X2 n=1 Tax=Microcaecilia unicolor TaxID=1415580 RepID=A0A6P7ZFL4_9AMPH|nr:solute carrier family 22 member 6-B-like isoform X2 [Microcaecilia unicolor]XP_030075176.1 solute carrier family 22 member 6-B-like isoform X2 [Microcaecilia unicolor]